MSGQNEVVRVFWGYGLIDFDSKVIRGSLITFPRTTCFDFSPRTPGEPAPAHFSRKISRFLSVTLCPKVRHLLAENFLSIMADRVVCSIHQKMAAYVEFWPGKVACHKIFNLSTFVLPKISCAVICQCFSATYCCVGNGSPLSLIHASMRKSPSQF